MGIERSKASGIYRITVSKPGKPPKFYIGQASNIRVRHQGHMWKLRKGLHNNPLLMLAFAKYGEEAFHFEVLAVCPREKTVLDLYEQKILDWHIAEYGEDSALNVLKNCVNSRLGIPSSEETKAKQSAALKGRKRSSEEVERLRRFNTGRKQPAEAIAKRTAKQRGRVVSAEVRAKHAAANRGRVASEETRQRISQSKRGWKPSANHLEHLARQFELNREKLRSPEVVEKVASQKRGVPRHPDVLAKAWATRRAKMAENS